MKIEPRTFTLPNGEVLTVHSLCADDAESKPPVRLNLWKFRVIVIFKQINVIFHPAISAPFVGFCSEKHPLHVLKPCKIRAETVHLLSDKQNRPIPHRLDGIGLSGRTPKIKSRRILL